MSHAVRTFLSEDQYDWLRKTARRIIMEHRPHLREPADALMVRAAVKVAMRSSDEDMVAAVLAELQRGAGE